MKTVLITGAAGHLGKVTVLTFLENGYRVIAVGNHPEPPQPALANKPYHFFQVNLSEEAQTTLFSQKLLLEFPELEAVLFLAGGFGMGNLTATGSEELHQMFALNFETAFYLSRSVIRHLQDKGYGRLVYIGARPALDPAAGKNMIAYTLSKTLLLKLAELINAETRGTNVVASVVVPSTLDTPVNRSAMPNADPSGWVKPEAFAELILFICSEKGMALREPVYKIYNNA